MLLPDADSALLLRDATIPGYDGLRDIFLNDGLVQWVRVPGDRLMLPVGQSIDLSGKVVIPSFVESHTHLDKALLGPDRAGADGLASAIEAFTSDLYRQMNYQDIFSRSLAVLRIAVARGVTSIRTHVDCRPDCDLEGLRALSRIRRDLKGVIDIQIVALMTPPVEDNRRTRERIGLILKEKPDALGGCPSLERDPEEAIEVTLQEAASAGIRVDLHVDESLDVGQNSLEILSNKVIETNFPYQVTASHCVSLGQQVETTQSRIIEHLAVSGISIVTLPQTNLFLQARSFRSNTPRGMPPLLDLLDGGILIAAGGDNWRDPFNPLSRIDPLETLSLLVSAGHVPVMTALDMVTTYGRDVLGLPRTRIEAGSDASMVALRGSSLFEALSDASDERLVISHGQIVSQIWSQRILCGKLRPAEG